MSELEDIPEHPMLVSTILFDRRRGSDGLAGMQKKILDQMCKNVDRQRPWLLVCYAIKKWSKPWTCEYSQASACSQVVLTTRHRNTTSRCSPHYAISAYVRAGSHLEHGEVERRLGQIDIASTTSGHHNHRIEDLPSPSDELAPSIRRVSLAGILQRIRPCFFLVALGFLVIGGSLAVGLYYSIAKDRMGDGFTTAGWMIAVGTLVLAAPMAKHYPHCRCWVTRYSVLCHGCNTQV
jgi:hypothetical protein